MKLFLIFGRSNDGRQVNGQFEAENEQIAMVKATCRFSKELNVAVDEIFVTYCEENPRFQWTSK